MEGVGAKGQSKEGATKKFCEKWVAVEMRLESRECRFKKGGGK
jgi:hypothetical protein